jgi:hypothetical protein
VGWVFFRAESVDAATRMLEGMAGLNGVSIPNAVFVRLGPAREWLANLGVSSHLGQGRQFVFTYLWVMALVPIALFMPNTQQIMRRFRPTLAKHVTPIGASLTLGQRRFGRLMWQPTRAWATLIGLLAATGFLALTSVSEFLYFQF